jgi:hypothetical protein
LVKHTLTQKDVEFNFVNDIEVMSMMGFKSAPMLEVDGNIMNAKEAISWIS